MELLLQCCIENCGLVVKIFDVDQKSQVQIHLLLCRLPLHPLGYHLVERARRQKLSTFAFTIRPIVTLGCVVLNCTDSEFC